MVHFDAGLFFVTWTTESVLGLPTGLPWPIHVEELGQGRPHHTSPSHVELPETQLVSEKTA